MGYVSRVRQVIALRVDDRLCRVSTPPAVTRLCAMLVDTSFLSSSCRIRWPDAADRGWNPVHLTPSLVDSGALKSASSMITCVFTCRTDQERPSFTGTLARGIDEMKFTEAASSRNYPKRLRARNKWLGLLQVQRWERLADDG